jgi:hydroxymethylpyrimidine pyrophosphatase-like HAD family hydrolase
MQVDHLDPDNLGLLRFNAMWEAYYRQDSLLVFSTGRSPTIYKQLRKEKPLLTPDIAIMSVGTEIMYGESMIRDEDWEQYLNKNWNREIVTEETAQFPELTPQVRCLANDIDYYIWYLSLEIDYKRAYILILLLFHGEELKSYTNYYDDTRLLCILSSNILNFNGSLQSETEQRPHKVSFFVEKIKALKVIRSLSERLEKRGVRLHLFADS